MPIQLLDHADSIRRAIAPGIALKRKSALGQFMTPAPVARFMASMFPPSTLPKCILLDAGAGVGALTCSFLDRWVASDGFSFHDRFIKFVHKTGRSAFHSDCFLSEGAGAFRPLNAGLQ